MRCKICDRQYKFRSGGWGRFKRIREDTCRHCGGKLDG